MQQATSGLFRWLCASERDKFWARMIRNLRPRFKGYIANSGCGFDEKEEIFWDVIQELFALEPSLVCCTDPWERALPILRKACAREKQRCRHEVAGRLDVFPASDPNDWALRELHALRLQIWCQRLLKALPPRQRRAIQRAAECAGDQGHFEGMYRALYLSRDSLGRIPYRELARRAGVENMPDFDSCFADTSPVDRVEADMNAAETLRISGTPALVVDGKLLAGQLTERDLEGLVLRAAGKR